MTNTTGALIELLKGSSKILLATDCASRSVSSVRKSSGVFAVSAEQTVQALVNSNFPGALETRLVVMSQFEQALGYLAAKAWLFSVK